jgi:uncharacterized protein (DUF433 family)
LTLLTVLTQMSAFVSVNVRRQASQFLSRPNGSPTSPKSSFWSRKLGGPSAPSAQFCHDISGWLRALLVILASPRALGSSNVSLEKLSGQSTMTEHPRISLAPDMLVGKPVIRGTRLSVEFVIGLMADGWSEADILGNYPGITHDDIIACLAYARDTLSSEKVFPSAA